MPALLARIVILLRLAWVKLWPWILAQLGLETARQVAKLPVRLAVMTAWAVFLGVVFTGLTGLGLVTAFNTNPLSGVSGDVMGLVCAVFPVHFFFGLVQAYVTWRFTLRKALSLLDRTLLYIFGP